jgi:serine/threonine-protein kinase
MSSDVPSRIGRYAIDRLIGSGAMGNVFLGRDQELDRAVAVKTVRTHDLPPEAKQVYLDRFKNEARAAARLHHPSIVAVYDVGDDPEAGPFLVLEYVAGSSLKQILQGRGPLEPAAVVALAEQIGRALDIAHAARIIHRDIKPDNLLITPEGRAKLADFGVARVPDAALTREGQFLGTPCYAAPETLRSGDYGPRTDLFSLAAVLYETISGTRAFPGDEAVAVAHKVLHDEPPPPSAVARGGVAVPSAVDSVIMRGLSKDASRRPGSASDLARELRSAYASAGAIEGGGDTATDSSGGAGAGPTVPASASRGGAAVFLSVILVGLVIAIGIVWYNRDDPSELALSSLLDAGTDAGRDSGAVVAAPTLDAGVDLGAVDLGAADSGAHVDAGLAAEAGADAAQADDNTFDHMTTRQREDAAKDALDRARDLINTGDLAGADRALADARRLDPGNGDLETVAAEINAQRP